MYYLSPILLLAILFVACADCSRLRSTLSKVQKPVNKLERRVEHIAKEGASFVIDCIFKRNSSNGVLNNVRISPDVSTIVGYIDEEGLMRRYKGFPRIQKTLGMQLEAKALNHIRVLFDRVPKALDSRAVNCFSTEDRGLGMQLEIIRNIVYLMRPPQLIRSTFVKNVQMHEGQMTPDNVTCEATGLPPPVVEWFGPKDKLRAFSAKGQRSRGGSELRTAVLYLGSGPVKRSMAGVYRCVARLSFDDQKLVREKPTDTAVMRVSVLYKPKISVTQRLIYSDIGATEEVKIEVEANPRPTEVHCSLLDSKGPKRAAVLLSKDSVIYVVRMAPIRRHDAGKYSCTARNEMGNATTHFKLTVEPPSPIIVSPHRAEYSNYYNFRWRPGSKAKLSNVTLQLRTKQRNGSLTMLRESTQSLFGQPQRLFEHHVTNLTHNTMHELRARVCSRYACSKFSMPVSFKTRNDPKGTFTADPSAFQSSSYGGRTHNLGFRLAPSAGLTWFAIVMRLLRC